VGYVVALSLLLFALFALLLQAQLNISLAVLTFLAAAFAISRGWSRAATRGLRVRRRFVDRAFAGEEVTVQLRLENTGYLPVTWLEIEEEVPAGLAGEQRPVHVLGLGPRQRRDFSYTVYCRSRGYYQLGPLRAMAGDLLGLDNRVLHLHDSSRLIVYPRVVPLERLGLPSSSVLATLPTRMALFQDLSRVRGVRDYQSGDSLRSIHWTASARTGQLVVKQYEPAISRETLICLDLDFKGYLVQGRHAAMELAIVAAASLAHHMISRERLAAGIAIQALDGLHGDIRRIKLAPRAESSHLIAILEVLARVQGAAGDGLLQLLQLESVALAVGATVVVIGGRLDDQISAALLQLKRSGHAVVFLLVQPVWDVSNVPGIPGIPIHRVSWPHDLVGIA